LTAAAGGSQTTRFERFTLQASTSGGGIDFPPWALRQWLRRRQRRDLVRRIFLVVREMIVSHPGVIVLEQQAAEPGHQGDA
jgi:hypothetical protein